MCFKTLPLEVDAAGNAQLSGGFPNPYSVSTARPEVHMTEAQRTAQIERLVERNGHIKDLNMDPVTRIAGSMAMHMTADLHDRKYIQAHSQAPLFRGYEVILMGRDPRDATYIASRACGVCGGVHAHAAAYATEMALGLAPPPMGTLVRNLGETAEMGYDNPLHLYLLAGPDYSEPVIKATNPELWPKAEQWRCPGEPYHGFRTMAEIMTALTPLTGELYREGLTFTRLAREMFVLFHGKYPHPQTIIPGGVTSTVSVQTLNEYHARLGEIFDYAQRMMSIWNDIPEFFYAVDERYKEVGALPMNFVDLGFWDQPEYYDATYENCNEWGEHRWSTPGVIINGELVTTRLTDINIGWEEFVAHSYYDEWTDGNGNGKRYETDPLDNPLSPYHPWNKNTIPKPQEKSFKGKYSYSTSPRWDREVVEAGAYARLFLTAKAQKLPPNDYIEATGHSIRMKVPKGRRPEAEVEWYVPEVWNTFERNRGRAYHYLFSQLVGLNNLLDAYRLLRRGEDKVARLNSKELDRHVQKGEGRGAGFWGAGRGWLSHHAVVEQGKLTNYQICTPSTINASPRDPWDQPGPFEQAVLNTPILEQMRDPSEFTSVDMLRAIRSFDPCMPCTTHVSTGHGTVVREVNTCACGAE